MAPEPITIRDGYVGTGRLAGKAALVTGGDSGIDRAIAVHFAREGADVAIAYLEEGEDAAESKALVEANGRRCLLIRGDLRTPMRCIAAVRKTVDTSGASTSWSTITRSSIRSIRPRS